MSRTAGDRRYNARCVGAWRGRWPPCRVNRSIRSVIGKSAIAVGRKTAVIFAVTAGEPRGTGDKPFAACRWQRSMSCGSGKKFKKCCLADLE
ncbi:MAG: hypothetical protein E5V74_23510 [Mesorhizobium sp.]|nr:MAG: hypothetical protein E5V86_03710 [Mesorhizobium sp.]TIV94438.1 MAG: hypothetical protein E5V74_23510 [Mesorhizobium sp.]